MEFTNQELLERDAGIIWGYVMKKSPFHSREQYAKSQYKLCQESETAYEEIKENCLQIAGIVADWNQETLPLIDKYSETKDFVEAERISFDISRILFRKASRVLGLEGAEEFLKFYIINSDHLFGEKDKAVMFLHLLYLKKGLSFEDFMIDNHKKRTPDYILED